MNAEKKLISVISDPMPRSPRQVNSLFTADSEILKSSKGFLLFSVDDYSEEDHFRTDDPYTLGWNLAVATISDVFASGGLVSYYSHSMSVNNKDWDENYLNLFSKGIADVLNSIGAFFLGGDFGFSEKWHYTGIALGKSIRALTRIGAKEGDTIFMTGSAGAGNIEAALQLFNPGNETIKIKFTPRHEEAKLIARYAGCCIDSSDGVAVTLNILSELNSTGYRVETIKIYPAAGEIAAQLQVPVELLLLGECGEYELIFTVNKHKKEEFLEEAEMLGLDFTAIGEITAPGERTIKAGNSLIDLNEFKIRGRDFKTEQEYISELIKYLKYHGTFKDN
ncbi:MAG: hypothetical protein JXR31_00900 [Prolixibacteraceae bacterium]|nr:hypothetical protein [Prolixibacteraceae bacterium]